MYKIIAVMLFASTLFCNGYIVEAKSNKSAEIKAYQKILCEMKVTVNTYEYELPQNSKYLIKDTTGDKIPELIIATNYEMGESVVDMVYTYYNNKVKLVSYSDHGGVIVFEKGVLMGKNHTNMGYYQETYFKIVKGKEKIVAYCTDDSASGNENAAGEQYYLNDKKVSKSKFSKFGKPENKNRLSEIFNGQYINYLKKNDKEANYEKEKSEKSDFDAIDKYFDSIDNNYNTFDWKGSRGRSVSTREKSTKSI